MEAFTPYIIQAVGGVVGALGASAALKQASMNAATKVIAGVIGGVGLGQILGVVLTDMSGPLIDGVGGVAGGAVLTALAGMVMKKS